MGTYHKSRKEATPTPARHVPSEAVRLTLEEQIRKAFQEKLPELFEAELQEYLGRAWYERHQGPEEAKQYRNGYGKPRKVSSGVGVAGCIRCAMCSIRSHSQLTMKFNRNSGPCITPETVRKLSS